MLARVTRGVDFSFNPANAKSAGNQDAGYIFQLAIDAALQGFGIYKFQVDSTVFARRGMGERFVDTLISITDIHVFADYGDLDASFWANDAFDKFPPVCQIGFRSFQMQKIADQRVQSLGVQHQRHFVNRVLDVALLDNRLF